MIVPMKKVFILLMDREKNTALETIRELGTVHLKNHTASSPDLIKHKDRHIKIDFALRILSLFHVKKGMDIQQVTHNGDVVEHVINLSERRKILQEDILQLKRELENLRRWGSFDPQSFQEMCDNGVKAYFYDLPQRIYEENVGEVPVIILSKDKKSNMVSLIAFDEIPNVTPLVTPKQSLTEVSLILENRINELYKIESELFGLGHYGKQLEEEKKSLLSDIEFETAKAGMNLIDEDDEMQISWISGYIPATELETLKNAAVSNGWALSAADPIETDEDVPTQLKNNGMASLIYPLTDFLEISPGYRETDISGLFLMFIALFFAMIFGDAGYGMFISGLALLGMFLTRKKGVPAFFKFLLLMGSATAVWGALSGAWFGYDIAAIPQFLQNISLPLVAGPSSAPGWIDSYNLNNYWITSGLIQPFESLEAAEGINFSNLILMCFSIAFIHLGIGRIKCIISNIRSLKVLGDIGVFGVLIGMYHVALSLVAYNIGFDGVKTWHLFSTGGGFALFFLFANYEGNLARSIRASLANIISVLLSVVNVFTDIMSYIRLWAVAVAGGALASTINDMAGPMLSNILLLVCGIAIMLFGHGFNLILNVLAVLVHGVRLNTLEFSGVIGLNWSGFKYKPFAKRR